MIDPQKILDDAAHVVLNAWITTYLRLDAGEAVALPPRLPSGLTEQTMRLRESAVLLQAALEKMRLANEKLAARMAEHKAFFAKYQAPE